MPSPRVPPSSMRGHCAQGDAELWHSRHWHRTPGVIGALQRMKSSDQRSLHSQSQVSKELRKLVARFRQLNHRRREVESSMAARIGRERRGTPPSLR